MSGAFALLADGAPADDIVAAMALLEVEENADAPGAFALTLPLSAVDGELNWIDDPRLQPHAPIAVVARGNGPEEECVFDGMVLAHSAKVAPGVVDSSLRVWGQDASWLMNLDEKVNEWVNMTDAGVAAAIFNDYGITPGPDNNADDTPTHSEDGHSLIQRGTDAQFLKRLAGRSGKLFRVTNGSAPNERIGIFARPQLGGSPVASLIVADIANANVSGIEIAWDVMRATRASGGQALLASSDPATASESDGLTSLDARSLSDFASKPSTALVEAVIDDAGELTLRAQAALIDSQFFVRVTGSADVAQLGTVLRVGTLVSLETVGSIHSGTYYVWSVRHSLTPERHEMRFELVRNAVGKGSASGGLLGGLGL
jgi:hypothetical protein